MAKKIALTILLFVSTASFTMEEIDPLIESLAAKTFHSVIANLKDIPRCLPKAIWEFAQECWDPDGYADAEGLPCPSLKEFIFGKNE